MREQYLAERFPPGSAVSHLRLGQPKGFSKGNPAPYEERQVKMGTLKEADAVWRDGSSALIMEFAVWHPQDKLGKLPLYRDLLDATPGYFDLEPSKVALRLVIGVDDEVVRRYAEKLGVGYEVFNPPWLRAEIAKRRGG